MNPFSVGGQVSRDVISTGLPDLRNLYLLFWCGLNGVIYFSRLHWVSYIQLAPMGLDGFCSYGVWEDPLSFVPHLYASNLTSSRWFLVLSWVINALSITAGLILNARCDAEKLSIRCMTGIQLSNVVFVFDTLTDGMKLESTNILTRHVVKSPIYYFLGYVWIGNRLRMANMLLSVPSGINRSGLLDPDYALDLLQYGPLRYHRTSNFDKGWLTASGVALPVPTNYHGLGHLYPARCNTSTSSPWLYLFA